MTTWQDRIGDPATSPAYVACGEDCDLADTAALDEMLGLIELGRTYVLHRDAVDAVDDVLHHHGGKHREFLVTPFDQARRAIENRQRRFNA